MTQLLTTTHIVRGLVVVRYRQLLELSQFKARAGDLSIGGGGATACGGRRRGRDGVRRPGQEVRDA